MLDTIPITLQVLIDAINKGDRSALFALSDYYREQGDHQAGDCFEWCWKLERWPDQNWHHDLFAFESSPMTGPSTARIGNQFYWRISALRKTKSPTIFGAFQNFLEKMWRKSPEHVAKLMKELRQ